MAALAVSAALIAALATPTMRHLREAPPPAPPALQFALSPDGRSLAVVASGDGLPRLWLRLPDHTEARPLAVGSVSRPVKPHT
jgi:hypothetical protein